MTTQTHRLHVRFSAVTVENRTVWTAQVPFLILFWQQLRSNPGGNVPQCKWPVAKFDTLQQAVDAVQEYYDTSRGDWLSYLLEGIWKGKIDQ